ncbi:DUF5313 domain-containing protein [Gordonia alkaliphila]|uniref:DUF5313 family protein n=1 Tax=Gordonia alkaliphila TaxID=1053547 RepID=UPI001FF10A9E|nr:DUF5313 family protein [Gordonia alkaliphila]MCK0438290.1 DUF5313 domain-containing protein [Gordonia alkaliphila]
MSATRPGPLQRIGYLLGRRLPPEMSDWVRKDITGRGHVVRYLLRGFIPFLPIAIGLCFVPGSWMVRAGMILLLAIPLLYFQLALMNIYRRHLLRNNGLDPKLADKVTIVRLSEAEALYRSQHRPQEVSMAPYDVPQPATPPTPQNRAVIDSVIVEPKDPEQSSGPDAPGQAKV